MNCRRVSRTSGLLRLDQLEALHHAVEVLDYLAVGLPQVGDDMLADGVERPIALPRVEDVPKIDPFVRRVHIDVHTGDLPAPVEVAEAGPAVAARDVGPAGIAPKVHVYLADAALEVDEAL